jgi:cytochrome c peroxidase
LPPEIDALVEFLDKGLYDDRLMRYVPQHLPSGNCFPVNDPEAQDDLGCRNGGPL